MGILWKKIGVIDNSRERITDLTVKFKKILIDLIEFHISTIVSMLVVQEQIFKVS